MIISLDYFISVQKLRFEKWLFIDHTRVGRILIVEGLEKLQPNNEIFSLFMNWFVYRWWNI